MHTHKLAIWILRHPVLPKSIQYLENYSSRLLKDILWLPNSTCTDLLFLPANSIGCQLRSLIPIYVQTAGEFLAIEDCR